MTKLCELISGLEAAQIIGSGQTEISGIFYDSRKVRPGSLFVCIKGYVTDGHEYISKAVQAGAAAIMIQEGDVPDGVVCVRTADTRSGLAHVSAVYFGHPASRISMVGITGTKGKTTTAFMTDSIFVSDGKENALIGTILTRIGNETVLSSRTTPESYDLQEIFARCVQEGIGSLVMEVSSQGLKLKRVLGCRFETAVFTNMYNDHIGPAEHDDMQDYIDSKAMIFDMCSNAVINIDDPYSDIMIERAVQNKDVDIYTVGISGKADVTASDIIKISDRDRFGTSFIVSSPWYEGEVFVGLPGVFNVYNALCAIACAGIRGKSFDAVRKGLGELAIKGRVQPVKTGRDFQVIVDYAHNAASLENLLYTLRDYTEGKLVCVFGCGGNRARSRRFEMGEVSGKLADLTVITSDNPRKEDPDAIIADIETGMKKTSGNYIMITDRTEAIRSAVQGAGKGDIIVIAGKGHETYQEFADRVIHYDDSEIAQAVLEGNI